MTRSLGVARLGRLVVSVLTITALASCSALGGSDADSDGGGSTQVEKTKIKVGVIEGLIDIAGFKRAVNAGYFKDEGLEVETIGVKSATEVVPQLTAGTMDFGFGNWTSFIQAQASKVLDMRMVADGLQSKEGMSALCALPNSGITGPKDLAGKAIGINAKKGNVELSVRAILEANDVDASSVDFQVIPTAEAIQALQTGRIPVMSLQEPNLTLAKQTLGAVVVADRATGPVADFPIAGYVAATKFTDKNPKTTAAFQRAVQKGQADVADRQILEKTLLSYTKIDANVAKTVVAGVFPTSLDKTRIQRVADLMYTYKILDKKFDVGAMIYKAPKS